MSNDILVSMQEDLERAKKRSPQQRRWAMLIDLRKCVGCHACTIGCVSENKLPPGHYYRPVKEYSRGKYPHLSTTYLARPCMHCDKPPCVDACPVPGKDGATWKETDGTGAGLVMINYTKCIGCGQCVPACPYEARKLDEGKSFTQTSPAPQQYEMMPSFEYGKAWPRKGEEPPIGKARKCHFCVHRLAEAALPVCTSTCIGRATYFGDENDPESVIAQTLKFNAGNIQVLKPSKGTSPRVYYIANVKLENVYGK